MIKYWIHLNDEEYGKKIIGDFKREDEALDAGTALYIDDIKDDYFDGDELIDENIVLEFDLSKEVKAHSAFMIENILDIFLESFDDELHEEIQDSNRLLIASAKYGCTEEEWARKSKNERLELNKRAKNLNNDLSAAIEDTLKKYDINLDLNTLTFVKAKRIKIKELMDKYECF